MTRDLDAVILKSAQAEGPALTDPLGLPRIGGVDPLGLRQLNFDLMDAVLPGLNNVGRHIRPFVVVAWAARRARHLAEASGSQQISDRLIRDFIDRIEVLYAWSNFLIDSGAQLPGRLVLQSLIDREHYAFGGPDWEDFCASRRASTAFTAAITYGPSIKALHWAGPIKGSGHAWGSSGQFDTALDAFEATLGDALEHPAFSRLGEVEVTREEARRWGVLWDMRHVTAQEQDAFSDALAGSKANARRRDSIGLLRDILRDDPDADLETLRAAMTKAVGAAAPVRVAWRRLQVRQAFRYALESWFHWCLAHLEAGPKSTAELVGIFQSAAGGWAVSDTQGAWLVSPDEACPVALMAKIGAALDHDLNAVPEAVCQTLAFCLAETDLDRASGRADRLPLWRARQEAGSWKHATPAEFVTHMMETWLFAQHAYWSSSRGLDDARSGGKIILRLRVALDEGGWRLTRLGGIGSQPYPTPDRLETAWRLAKECGLL